MSKKRSRLSISSLAASLALSAGCAPQDAASLYAEHCASCHGDRRYGGYSSPLLPDVLARRTDDQLVEIVLKGLPSTQMEGFEQALDADDARALSALLREPVENISWERSDIAASRREEPESPGKIPGSVRRENLILVVERGTGSLVVLDGDSLDELDRFVVGRIHGGPKFDSAYRSVVAATRDGTIVDYDLEKGRVRTRVKVAVNTRNIALSPDGNLVAAANLLPANVVILDRTLRPLAVLDLPGQPSAVYSNPGAPGFVLTLRDAPLLLSISHSDFAMHRVELPEPFEDFTFVPGRRQILASSRGGKRIILYDLDSERVIGSLATEGLPHLFSACFFTRDGALHAALNHVGRPRLSILQMDTFRIEKEIPLGGSGYFVRTHPGTPYLWADTNTERIELVEKRSLSLSPRALIPDEGKKAMHVEFTDDGSRALVSVWDPEGAVVVYDSTTLDEVARLPYAMPVGKYNAFNKTRLLH
jgi:cytochrome c553